MVRLFTTFLLLLLTTFLFAQAPTFQGQSFRSDFQDSPELLYQFQEFDVYQIDVEAFDKYVKSAGQSMQFNLILGNEYNWDIYLEPRDMRKPGYLRRWVTADGIVEMPPTENITFRGKLEAPGGRSVSLTIDEDLLRGFVKTEEDMYFIEPVSNFIKGQPKDLFVVYQACKVIPREDARCGYSELMNKTEKYAPKQGQEHGKTEKAVACLEVEIAIASDWEMFQDFGSGGAVEGFETGVLADVQTNYDDEFADELLFVIVEFFTVTSAGGDPWTTSNNAGTLLNSFTNWGPGGFGATHDVGALWTGRNFTGGTIGIAWLSAVCTNIRYHCLENFSSNACLLRVLWAHELGHNFGANHTGGGTIMAPSVNCTSTWSPTSINQINNYVSSISCLGACGGALPPIAAFTANPTEGCAPLVVQFNDESQFSPLTWSWSFPGGNPSTSTAQNPIVEYNVPGIYSVTLTVENVAGNNSLTQTDFIIVNGVPVADFTFDQIGTTVIFTNTSTGATNYLWDFGDGNTSTEENPVHVYATEGFYDVSLTAINDCGAETDFFNIPVFTPPTAGFIADPTSGCAPLEVEFFDNSSTNTIFWFWEFDGGTPSISNDPNPVVEYTTPGIYDVKLTVSNPAGDDDITITDYIFVGTTATPDFSFMVSGSAVSFTNESDNSMGIGPMTYNWQFGDGETSTEENPVHTYATNGTFDVILTVSNDCGSATITQSVVILLPPTAAFSAPETQGCASFVVTFDNESSANANSFEWDFPGGTPSSSNEENPTITYNDPGTYDVTLIAFNSAGSDTVTLTNYITVDPPAIPAFTSNANGLTVAFTNSSSNATSYEWDFGDGNTSTEENPVHTYAADGNYTVTLTATNDCGSITTTQTVTVITAPTAGFSSNVTTGCDPLTVQFTNESSANAVSYEWSFPGGDPSSSTDENPMVTYDTPGSYTVTLIATNSAGSSTATETNYIVVTTVPSAGFSSSTNGLTVSFTNNSSNATSYSWDFGDGESSTEANPVHTYDDDGVYTVTLTATNDCGSVISTEEVTIITAPIAAFSANNASGCAELTVTFNNESSANATSYEWEFPGGTPSSSTEENPTVTYPTPGTYNVTLTVSNSAGSNTVEEISFVVVNTVPAPSFNVSTNVFTATFTNTTANATSYEWDFGDGTSSTEENPVHEYPGDGTYTATLTAFNDCGSSTETVNVVITSLPQAGFSATETTGCSSFTVQFMDESSSNTTSWEWEFPGGNPSSSTEQNPTVVYDNVGTYTVTLTATNSLGESTVEQTNYITVITTPTAGFSSSANGLTVAFTNNSAGATAYSWDFGDGNNSTESDPTHTYDEDGTYEVILTATNECGSVTSMQTVMIATAPTAAFTVSATNGCVPFEVQFTNQSSANTESFEWSFPGGDPSSSTEENPTVVYNEPGTYNVTLTAINSAGENEVTEMGYIVVGDIPTASFTTDVNGFTVDFTNTSTNPPNSGNLSFEWEFGDGNTSTEENPQHTYAADGTYAVTFTVTNDCGPKVINGQVNVVSAPTASFSAQETTGCAPFVVQFQNESSANTESFAWEFPGGDPATSDSENPTVTYNAPGVYDVILTVTNSAGSDEIIQTSYITVNDAPTTAFGFNVGDSDVSFFNQSDNFTQVEWDFGDGNTSNETDPLHTYAEDGAYTVTLTTTNECGSTTATEIVVIATEGPIAAFTVASQTGCAPYEVTFENLSSSNAESFEWTFEGGSPATSTEENPTVTYDTPGTYDVALIAFNGIGSDTFEVMAYITVEALPTPGFTADNNWETITFTNTSTNATTYLWDFGDGNSSNEADPVHTYEEAGEYEVTLRAENDCGFNVITQIIVVMANAVGEIPGISEFNIWPNPNNGRFTMTLRGETKGELEINFTNLLGQVILQQPLDFRTGNVTQEFAFDNLAAGIYIFQIKSGHKAIHRKLVVE
ncbi:MAG: PKD domain-containing protein [Bacteroidota bacterium]